MMKEQNTQNLRVWCQMISKIYDEPKQSSNEKSYNARTKITKLNMLVSNDICNCR